MPNHKIFIDYDKQQKKWYVKEHDEHDVKKNETVTWETHSHDHHTIVVKFPDTVVSPTQITVPGTAQVSSNPRDGKHPYQATVDGVEVGDTKSAPGIIIE
jgi:hypothetical protein